MFVVAWLIERLVLRHLVNNQEGATLLMATLGITCLPSRPGPDAVRQQHPTRSTWACQGPDLR